MKEKIGRVRFLLKGITIYSREKTGFDAKNNHCYSKSANFRLDIISKNNCKKPVVISYILSGLGSRNI